MDTLSPKEKSFWKRVSVGNDCWNWTGGMKEDGYGRFYHKGKYSKAHRTAWELTQGPIPTRAVVRHTCSSYGCVRPGHLQLDYRLTSKNVKEIRARLQAGEPCKPLADEFSISLNSVYDIRKGRTWKGVT